MTQQIIISRAWCDDHLAECLQSYDTGTGKTHHIEELTAEEARLKEFGYIYTGHNGGQYTYTRRASQPLILPLEWQMAVEARRETIDIDQDW